MRFIHNQIDEIAADPVLRWYGAALALVNSVTAAHWLLVSPVGRILDPTIPPICWPFVRNCQDLRLLSPQAVTVVVSLLFVAGIYNATLFTSKASPTAAYGLLGSVSLIKAIILFQDYRLILNQHYMAYWTVLPFLFLPGKRRALQYLIICFYFWAGTLKLNDEWISGLGLYGLRPLGLPAALIPTACLYVIALELVIVFGLLSKRDWVFWAAFGQLILFHIASFWVVGFFYPILMFLLLTIFPLARYGQAAPPDARSVIGIGFTPLRRGAERPATYALLTGFCLAQLAPFAFPGDRTLTGEGRMFALHMFDAPVDCRAIATIRSPGGQTESLSMRVPFLTQRIKCDPIVYFDLAQDFCRDVGGPDDFDLVLESRKQGQRAFRTVVSVPSFCATDPHYSIWRHNWWIRSTD